MLPIAIDALKNTFGDFIKHINMKNIIMSAKFSRDMQADILGLLCVQRSTFQHSYMHRRTEKNNFQIILGPLV